MKRPKLILGDCLDVLRRLPDGCVDAVVTDPPYGIGYRNARGDFRPHIDFSPALKGDHNGDAGQKAIDECFRRDWPVCAFAHHRRPWRGDWRQWLVWDKGPAVGGGGDRATWIESTGFASGRWRSRRGRFRFR